MDSENTYEENLLLFNELAHEAGVPDLGELVSQLSKQVDDYRDRVISSLELHQSWMNGEVTDEGMRILLPRALSGGGCEDYQK